MVLPQWSSTSCVSLTVWGLFGKGLRVLFSRCVLAMTPSRMAIVPTERTLPCFNMHDHVVRSKLLTLERQQGMRLLPKPHNRYHMILCYARKYLASHMARIDSHPRNCKCIPVRPISRPSLRQVLDRRSRKQTSICTSLG